MQGEYTYIRSFEGAEEVPAARFIVFDANGQVTLCGAGAAADGVSVDSGDDGTFISVGLVGPAFVEVAEEILPGQRVESDANGRAVVLAEGESNGICLKKGLATDEDVDRAEVFIGA